MPRFSRNNARLSRSMYIDWLNGKIDELFIIATESSFSTQLFVNALNLGCDAHTKLVHIHPFIDENGRGSNSEWLGLEKHFDCNC